MTNNPPFANVSGTRSHFVSSGTNRIHYVTTGKGNRTIVLVHGWACNLGFWREQVPMLADIGRLVLIDLPGHGKSDKPQTAYTMDFFANAVLAVFRDAQAEKAIFIGHSMGVAAICRVYEQAPERFDALVSVDGLLRQPPGTPAEARALVETFWFAGLSRITPKVSSTHFPHARHRRVAEPRHGRDAHHSPTCHVGRECWECSAQTSPIGSCGKSTRLSLSSTSRVLGGAAIMNLTSVHSRRNLTTS